MYIHNNVRKRTCSYDKYDTNKSNNFKKRIKVSRTPFTTFRGKTPCGKYKIECFSPLNTANINDITIGSNKKCIFNCPSCMHSFTAQIFHVVNGRWCPYCAHTKLCTNLECNTCFQNSFASFNNKAPCGVIDKKDCLVSDTVDPRLIFLGSNKKYLFRCSLCAHTFKSIIYTVVEGKWCPYCARKRLCGDVNCVSCFEHSFASYIEKTSCGKLKIECLVTRDTNHKMSVCPLVYRIPLKSNKKYMFTCPTCTNTFNMRIYDVVYGKWCPHCNYKTQSLVYARLKTVYPDTICEWKPIWCSTPYLYCKLVDNVCCIVQSRMQYRFDFYIPSKNTIIELDGEQHFKQVSNWNSPLHNQIRDAYKSMKARRNGIRVIRIKRSFIKSNNANWEQYLFNTLLVHI